MSRYFSRFLFSMMMFSLLACQKNEKSVSDPVPTFSFSVSWTANKEAEVNRTGGGYRVFYSTSSPVDTASSQFQDVPYVSGAAAPTSVRMALPAGTHYLKVVAYSSMSADGSSGGSKSADSQEVSITLP